MEENLVIVESPAKAKTIEKFLGKEFIVKSSFGHIRDLSKKNLGIDIAHSFTPQYEIAADKKQIVNELKKLSAQSKTVWLASDEDREGEAIAWHLAEVLELPEDKTKRIVFHEITKNAIVNAIKTPRTIDHDLVNAQQARRILDRLVGFELSPVLWKKVRPALSAGRVQSVAVRLIVEREREIIAFNSVSSFKVTGVFLVYHENNNPVELKAELSRKFDTKEEARAFLERCIDAHYTITDITVKPGKKTPPPPFTTSTLQQEASRKLGFSVSQTMTIAQRLYEAGRITYMRTDSVHLSDDALNAAKEQIATMFGENYCNLRQHATKTKGAQEAHEAIRPTYMDKETVTGNATEKKLYELIWKRTLASQMSDAKLERTTVNISISKTDEIFIATGEVIKFDGFLKVYRESTDDESDGQAPKEESLPPLYKNDKLTLSHIDAIERFAYHPPRYTEASLVKKLEELGIGRPSTYAPTISTIQQRGYVEKDSREGVKRDYYLLNLKNNKIKEDTKTEIAGAEKNKLFPTDIGMVVNDFLVENFKDILDYHFTAKVEKEFDDIAAGKLEWVKMIDTFYKSFHQTVDITLKESQVSNGIRLLGTDPKSGKPIYARIGKFGPMAQLGESNTKEDKPLYASLLKSQHIETVTLEEALDLFKLPRKLGEYEEHTIEVATGRFGPYVKHNSKFTSLKDEDPLTITLEAAIALIEAKRTEDSKKVLKMFTEDAEMRVLNGRWGAYISYKSENFKIPKGTNVETLTHADCLKFIEQGASKKEKAPFKKKWKTK